MTHVHYKFSSKLSYNTVVFDGPSITQCELKRLIMAKEKLRATDCDLQITNAQSKEEYTDDDSPIPKGSSVIVRRVPASAIKSSSGANNRERSNGYNYNHGLFKSPMDDQRTPGVMPLFSEMANLASADISEDNKIEAMMNQSRYDGANYKRYGASLPANYMCYRCGSMDHHIRNCPVKQDKNADPPLRIKKSTGIPRSFMVHVDDPSIKGAMLTNSGHYAIPAIDAEAYATKKKKTPTQEQPSQDPIENPVPNELLCLICQDLLDDAVVIPCCGNSYCDDCIRTALLDSDDHVCPTCNQSEVSPDTLIANKFLRQAVNNFKKEQSYTQDVRKPCTTSQSQDSTPRPSPAPTPPPQSQPEKSQEAHTPTVTCSDLTPSSSSTSQVVVKVPDETPDTETDMKTNSSLASTSSALVSDAGFSESHSQPIPLVTSVTQTTTTDNTSSASASQSGQTSCCDRSTSASPSEGWTTINTHHPSSSSLSFSLTQSPDITVSHLQTYVSVQQQPLSCYPPGFSTNTPPWTPGPSTQGAPIPSFTSSIPPLVPVEWFTFSRRNNERTPPRGSTYSSSSRLSSRSHKSKSSCSSSRSPSRSKAHSRSRPHSPPSSHRTLSSRSHSSYSYGYKRSHSPTQTSSSSPRSHHHSRSRSPSDHHKDHHHHHHGHHHSKKSTSSSSSSSRRRGESSSTPRDTSECSLDTYLRWKQEYKDWCERYFSSYFSHFHQKPPPPFMPPQWPSPLPPSSTVHSSQSYSESSSSTSHLSSSSHSSTSYSDSHSTTTQSSSDATTPPSESCSGTSQEPSKVSQQRHMENQNNEEKSRKQQNENFDLHKSTSKKAYQHLKSKSFERKRKDLKLPDKEKRQERGEKEEKRYKAKASQKTADIDTDRSRQPGHSKSQYSRSDKSRKRKNEEAQRNQRENILTEPSPSVDLFPKLFEKEKQKKAVWKPQPVTEEDVWEGGVKVKPQKKISININLDPKKNEDANKQEAEAKSSSEYFEIDKEEETFPSQTDSDTKFNLEEETRDVKNDSWDISAEDEMVTAGEESDLWQCAFTTVEQEEHKADEESTRVKEVKMNCEQKEDHNERPNMAIDISCILGRSERVGCEDDQKTMMTVEEYMDRRSVEKRSELIQLNHSKWEMDAPEEKQLANVHLNDRVMKGRSERSRLVETDNDEEIDLRTSLDRSLVPSSGQVITDNSSDFDRKRKKGTVRERESRKEEEGGLHPERETLSTFYSKSSSAASQPFTSILEEQKHSRERRSRQVYMELDIECRGKYVKSYDNNHNQDSTVNYYSSWTSPHSQSHSRVSGQLPSKTSREDSPRQNWTCGSQHPATPTAQSSLNMVLDTDIKKERIRNERKEERMQDRQTSDSKGQADSERPSCSTKVSHNDDGKKDWRKDKKKQKADKKEKKHAALDEKKKSTKKKNKTERREDSSKEYILDKYS